MTGDINFMALGLIFSVFLIAGLIWKKYLLFGAIVFWVAFCIYLMQNNPIKSLQSWVWLLLVPLIVVPLLFSIMGSLLPKTKSDTGTDYEEEDWQDDEDNSYQTAQARYKKDSGVYKSKRKKRDYLR